MGWLMPTTCLCSRCRKPRAVELTDPGHGGRVTTPILSTGTEKKYTGYTAEPCECGERRVLIALRLGRLNGN